MTQDTTKRLAIEQAERAERVLHQARMLCAEFAAFARTADGAVQAVRSTADARAAREARETTTRQIELLAIQAARVLFYSGGAQVLTAHVPGAVSPPLEMDEMYRRMRQAFDNVEALGRVAA